MSLCMGTPTPSPQRETDTDMSTHHREALVIVGLLIVICCVVVSMLRYDAKSRRESAARYQRNVNLAKYLQRNDHGRLIRLNYDGGTTNSRTRAIYLMPVSGSSGRDRITIWANPHGGRFEIVVPERFAYNQLLSLIRDYQGDEVWLLVDHGVANPPPEPS